MTKGDIKDFRYLLLALGEMQMYGHVLNSELEKENSKKAKVAAETADDITGGTVEFIGSFDVIDTANEYGIEWNDIIESISDGEVVRK